MFRLDFFWLDIYITWLHVYVAMESEYTGQRLIVDISTLAIKMKT